MNHIGTQNIETERLLLRRVSMNDAEDMFYGWANDDEVTKYLTWRSHPDLEATKGYISFLLQKLEQNDCYDWIIEYKETGKAIGSIGVVRFNEDYETAEIGYCLSKKYWNKGIMTEAVNALLKYLFEKAGFNRVESYHYIKNAASGRVMQKNGMKFEGVKRQGAKDNKESFCDVAFYAVLKSDS